MQGFHLPFISVSTYHQIKFWEASTNGDRELVADVVHIQPVHPNAHRNPSLKAIHGQFNTVLVHSGNEGDTGVRGELMPVSTAFYSD